MTKRNNTPVIILAGGLGTRLREETEFRPKPMVPIGGKPILWHIMKIYSQYGFYRFIICLGYKGQMIKDYFLSYRLQDTDITINTKTGAIQEHQQNDEEWEITLVNTGDDCLTGGRIARAAQYVDSQTFMVTYGDGVGDINIEKLLQFHHAHKKMATLTSVKNPFRFGNLKLDENCVTSFLEKQHFADNWINGGFFVFDRSFLDYLSTDSQCVLEQQPLSKAALDGKLMAYKHNGFWYCMDTQRDHEKLQELWNGGMAPWKVWNMNAEYKPAQRDVEPLIIKVQSEIKETGL